MGRRAESCQPWRGPDFFLLSRGANKRPKPRQLQASGSNHSTAGPKDQGTKAQQVRSTPRQDRRFGLPVTVRLCASPTKSWWPEPRQREAMLPFRQRDWYRQTKMPRHKRRAPEPTASCRPAAVMSDECQVTSLDISQLKEKPFYQQSTFSEFL